MSARNQTAFALFALAVGVRIVFAAFAATQPDLAPQGPTFALLYAQQIASGFTWIGQPVSPAAPGYPVVLAVLYTISFQQIWLVVGLQALLAGVTVVLFYRLARQVVGETASIVAALWLALSVHHIFYSTLFMRDTVTVLVFLLLLLIIIRPFRSMRMAVLAGIVAAGLIHIDPQYLLLLPLLAIFVMFKSRARIVSLQYLFLFAGTILVVSLPWTIRNSIVYHQPVPIALEASRYFRPLLYITDDPVGHIEVRIEAASRTRRIPINAVEFWRVARFREGHVFQNSRVGTVPTADPAWSLRHNIISIVSFGLLLPFFIAGVIVAWWKRDRSALMLSATIAWYFAMRMYLGGSERARLPVEPLIVIVALYGLTQLWKAYKTRDHHTVV